MKVLDENYTQIHEYANGLPSKNGTVKVPDPVQFDFEKHQSMLIAKRARKLMTAEKGKLKRSISSEEIFAKGLPQSRYKTKKQRFFEEKINKQLNISKGGIIEDFILNGKYNCHCKILYM